MKTNVYLGLAIRIIVVFAIGLFATYLPEHLREFFGDTLHTCKMSGGSYNRCLTHSEFDSTYDWGARHYWYHLMMMSLFALSVVNAVMGARELIKSNYDLETPDEKQN